MPGSPGEAPQSSSLDVEEHDRIEAAQGVDVPTRQRDDYWARRAAATFRLIDLLAQRGIRANIFVHDCHGVADAPTVPFRVRSGGADLIELPPATLRAGAARVPVGGGGYFRLLPGPVFRAALRRTRRQAGPWPTVLYLHPWEVDEDLPRLPLRSPSRQRTYIGLRQTRSRLARLFDSYPATTFARACDVVADLNIARTLLPAFDLDKQAHGPHSERSRTKDQSLG